MNLKITNIILNIMNILFVFKSLFEYKIDTRKFVFCFTLIFTFNCTIGFCFNINEMSKKIILHLYRKNLRSRRINKIINLIK